VCDLETSRIGAPYIYDISNLRVNAGRLLGTTYHQYAALKRLPIMSPLSYPGVKEVFPGPNVPTLHLIFLIN